MGTTSFGNGNAPGYGGSSVTGQGSSFGSSTGSSGFGSGNAPGNYNE